MCILPKDLALEFAAFCQRNPKPCPVIGMGAPGDPSLPDLGDIDIRTDVPRYRVFKDGKLIDEPTDVTKYWSDDLVTFVLGCSFSFERPLLEAGLRLQHVERDTHGAHVPHQHRLRAGGPVQGQDGGVDARVQAGRCHPRDPDHLALSGGARGARCTSACPRRSASRT